MKQVGTPFESVQYAMQIMAFFGSITAGLGYKAYHDQDIFAGLSSVGCLVITGLAAYNTMVLGLAGSYEDSIHSDNIGL
jgi:hypothetical protein